MIDDNKTEQIPPFQFKSNPQQNSFLSKEHTTKTIKCLIEKFNDSEIKWRALSYQIIHITEYFLNNEPLQQMNTLLKTMVDKYEQNPHIGWLQLFQAAMMHYENKLPKLLYKTIVNTLTLTIAKYTLKTYQQNINNITQSRSNYKSIQQSIIEIQKQKLIKQLQNVQVSEEMNENKKIMDRNKQICEHWRIYVEIVRSYVFQCVKDFQIGNIWLYYELILTLVLDDPLIQPNFYLSDAIVYEIIAKFKTIASLRIFNAIYHDIFHEICLLLRIYFYRMKQFLQKDSKIILATPKYPLVNHCSLIMRFIQKQFTDEHISLTKQEKLDCLMLLTSILSIKLPKSANYNQVLEFALQIVLFIDQQEQLTAIKSPQISQTIFYCGQLLSMIMHTNIDWVLQFCKKCNEHIQGKYLRRVLKIYKKGLMHLQINLINQEHQIYIYLRFILGFCGLMSVQKMDSSVQDVIRDNFCHIVRILEVIHGWEQEHSEKQEGAQQFEEIKQGYQRNKSKKEEFFQQKMYLNQKIEEKEEKGNDAQMHDEKEQKELKLNDEEIVLWNEQFYHKNSLTSIQNDDEIDIFRKAMIDVKNHNPELFESLLHNFTEKQMMLWVVELEREDDESDD